MERGEAETVAAALGGGPLAFLRARQGLLFARAGSSPPFSPVLRLLRAVWEREPERGRWIARNTVYTTAPVTASCLGAARVAGRRLREVARAVSGAPMAAPVGAIDVASWLPAPQRAPAALEPELAALVRAASSPDAMSLATGMAAQVASLLPPGAPRRAVAVLLVGPAGELLEWATNAASANPTRHAEVTAVELWQSRTGRPLPAGTRLFVTLKPCKLCAGAVWDAASDPARLRVVYAAEDRGSGARETVLDAGSMDRRRFAPGLLGLEVQFRR